LADVFDFDSLPDLFRRVHGATAYKWNQDDECRGRKIWYRYSDRVIRSERHYYATLNYIHYNPVKDRLVDSPYEWVWSSAGWYLEEYGREWMRDTWRRYPVGDYGQSWDDM
jgi:putative transposase